MQFFDKSNLKWHADFACTFIDYSEKQINNLRKLNKKTTVKHFFVIKCFWS